MPRQEFLQQSEKQHENTRSQRSYYRRTWTPVWEEVENSVIMKAIESLKQGMNNSLKELEEKYNKKIEEMSKEMEEKYNKMFEEMSKSLNDTLGNQETQSNR